MRSDLLIAVRVGESKPKEYVTLMRLTVGRIPQPDASGGRIKLDEIYSVELFTERGESWTLDKPKANESESLYLKTVATHDDCLLKFNPLPDVDYSKLQRNGENVPVLPVASDGLELEAVVRCPLLPSKMSRRSDYYLHLTFLFDDTLTGDQERSSDFHYSKITSKFAFLGEEEYQPQDRTMTAFLRAWHNESELGGTGKPKLFTSEFDEFAEHTSVLNRWITYFARPAGSRRCRLTIDYSWYCILPPLSPPVLWPYRLPLTGKYRDTPAFGGESRLVDCRAVQRPEDRNEARWTLSAYWVGVPTAQDDERTAPTPTSLWNSCVAKPYHDALRTAKGGQPGSIVPEFLPEGLSDAEQKWASIYDVLDREPHKKEINADGVDIRFHGLTPATETPMKTVVALRRFRDYRGEPIKRCFGIRRWGGQVGEFERLDGAGRSHFLAFDVIDVARRPAEAPPKPVENAPARVGALDLQFAERATGSDDEVETGDNAGRLRAWSHRPLNFPQQPDERVQPAVDGEISLYVDAFGPGGQDPNELEYTVEEQRRPGVLVMPFPKPSGERSKGGGVATGDRLIKSERGQPFTLVAREKAHEQLTHSLSLRLENTGDAQEGKVDFVVIDQHPTSIVRVKANLNLAAAGEIGNWSGDDPRGPSWEFADSRDGFNLILPAQAVGEEFIRDYKDYEVSKDPENRKEPPASAKPLHYRFSPPADFLLSRSPFEQNFSEAPWNLRRLLGFPGQRMPGMGVFSLEFELLYGLTTTVTTEGLLLSELDVRLGRVPGYLSDIRPVSAQRAAHGGPAKDENPIQALLDEYDAFKKRYKRFLDILKTRLALFQPDLAYRPLKRDGESPDLLLDRGVSYRFRSTRQVVHPIDPNRPSGGPYQSAEQGGLRGGVDWGFESANVYEEVIESGPSSSGSLVGPSFTMLGGNGFQKASFAKDKSSIYSNTFLGRTFFYSLERIGRIGALWNNAKHVIIYERSVTDTGQFPDESGSWLGRPVVRKVREYVEVLEEEREIPKPGAVENPDPRSRGFVLGSKFPQKIFPVKSKWGRDVPGGWIVPLYRPGEDPDVYPEPDVELKLAAPEGTGQAHLHRRVLNPEILHFYTSTDPNVGAETDLWGAVPDVDFPLTDVHRVPEQDEKGAEPAIDKHSPDGRLPNPPSVLPGYERFTFKLEVDDQTVNLMADRAKNAVAAVIENVALVRRSDQLIQDVADGVAEARKDITDEVTKVRGAAKKFAESLPGLATEIEKQVIESLHNNASDVKKKIGTRLDDLDTNLNQLPKALNDGVTKALELAYDPKNPVTDMVGAIKKRQSELEARWEGGWKETTEQTRKRIEEAISAVSDPLQRAQAIRQELEALRVQTELAESALSDVARKMKRAVGLMHEWKAELRRLEAEVQSRLTRFEAVIDGLEPKQLEREFKKRYKAETAAIFDTVFTHVSLLRKRLGTVLPGVAESLGAILNDGRLKKIKEKLESAEPPNFDEFRKKFVTDGESLLKTLEKKIKDEIKDREDVANGLLREIEAQLGDQFIDGILRDAGIGDAVSAANELATKIARKGMTEYTTAVNTINEGMTAADGYFTKANVLIGNSKDAIHEALGKVAEIETKVRAGIKNANDLAKAFLDDLLDDVDFIDPTIRAPEAEQLVRAAFAGLTENAYGALAEQVAPYEEMAREALRYFDDTKVDFDNLKKLGENTLRLASAYGKAPIAQATKLARDYLQYYPRRLGNVVDFTPATVLYNRFSREIGQLDLKSLGIRLPSRQLAEKFIADKLKGFDLSTILPDFAGINLSHLFKQFRIPEYNQDGIKVTHGFNPKTRSAWAQCDVDMPMHETMTLFNFGVVAVKLDRAFFHAKTRIAASPNSPPKREVNAYLRADWRLEISGSMVMTLEQATLRFDNRGKISFDMSPNGIVLADALNFVTDLMQSLKPDDVSGLVIEIIQAANGIPIGARAALNVALPTLASGAFSISGMSLMSRFEVAVDPARGFYIGAGLGISSKLRPFNLTILFLGGGGWFGVLAMYRPFAAKPDRLLTQLSIGISAGASLVFDVGVASGGVYLHVYLAVEYQYSRGSNDLRIILGVRLMGEVRVLGIITISLVLLLEASYQSGGALACRGMLSLKIKICWCFSITVKKSVTFVLAGTPKKEQKLDAPDRSMTHGLHPDAEHAEKEPPTAIKNAVSDYVSSFGE